MSYDTLCTGRPFLYWEGSWVATLSLVCLDSRTKLHLAQTLCSFCGLSQVRGRVRALTLYIVEGRAAGGEARPRSTGQQEAHLAKAGFRVQLVDMQLEATGRAASPRSQGGEVKSSAVLLRTLASASAFAPSKLCDPAEHI